MNAPAGWDMMKGRKRPSMDARFAGSLSIMVGDVSMGPPPAMAPMMTAAPATKAGGLVGAVKAMFGGGGEPPLPPPVGFGRASRDRAEPVDAFRAVLQSDLASALLQSQLASGLWGPDGGRAAETAAALSKLLDAGIDANHPVHGALITKAIRAAIKLAGSLTGDAAELLRSLAWLLSHAKRARAAIAAELPAPPDEARLRARVRELLAVVHPH